MPHPENIATASRADLIVVGGGVIGLSLAWRAAREGMTACVVDESPGSGASSAAAGMLAPVTEVHFGEEPLLQLNLAAAARYPSFVEELEEASGCVVGYRRCGTLVVAFDADDQAQLSQLRDYQLRLGLPVEALRTAEARRAEPALSPFIRGAYLAEGDDQVDPRALLRALFVAATRAGVSFIRERVVAVTIEGERARGVWTECQRHIAAAVTVIAAGWSSPQIEGVPEEVRPPIRPVKGQLLHLRGEAAPPLLQRNLRALVRGSSVYLVPRGDGRIVVGATVEERGTDTRVTADAVYTLLRDAHAVLPGIDDLELAETVASLRPGSPDNAPLIGWSGCEALAYATGHHRNGVLLAPVTADAVVEMVSTGTTPELLTAFSPSRFRLHEPVGAAR